MTSQRTRGHVVWLLLCVTHITTISSTWGLLSLEFGVSDYVNKNHSHYLVYTLPRYRMSLQLGKPYECQTCAYIISARVWDQ